MIVRWSIKGPLSDGTVGRDHGREGSHVKAKIFFSAKSCASKIVHHL